MNTTGGAGVKVGETGERINTVPFSAALSITQNSPAIHRVCRMR